MGSGSGGSPLVTVAPFELPLPPLLAPVALPLLALTLLLLVVLVLALLPLAVTLEFPLEELPFEGGPGGEMGVARMS